MSRALSGPEYPRDLRDQGISGTVHASFTIDTSGAVVHGSQTIDDETHAEFGNSVCDFLRRLRVTPFEINGKRHSVRLKRQPFVFTLSR